MNKIRGIVLQSTKDHFTLLTPGGEFRRLPCRGRPPAPGTEVEITPSLLPGAFPAYAAAALLVLVMALTLLWQYGPARPTAYLALDINPSMLLLLNAEAEVLRVECLNAEGATLGRKFKLKGLPVAEALDLILKEAYSSGYLLPAGQANVVFLSLAAPQDYIIGEEALQQAAAGQLFDLEVDAYLKIRATTPDAARDARQHKASLNALLLAEELAAMDLLPPPGDNLIQQGQDFPAVRDLLERVPAGNIFSEKDFIPGSSSPGKGKKQGAAQSNHPGRAEDMEENEREKEDKGPPDFTPPAKGKENTEENEREKEDKGPPDFTPPAKGKEKLPAHLSPGLP